MYKKYKFYINLLCFYIKNEFKDLINNLVIIINNKKMIFMFILLIPFVFCVIKIQILVGIVFFVFYLSQFLLYNNILESDYTISCRETPVNIKHLYKYSFFNVFVFVPQSKSFLIVYNFLNIIINNSLQKKEKIIFLLIFFFVSFFIKIYILLVVGYSFLSILITSDLIISYFETISWKYENNKAKYQHIVLNCLLNNKDSVGLADSMKIIIKDGKIIFNADKFLKYFLNKVKNPEKLQKAFTSEKKEILSKIFIDGHFSWSLSSLKYKSKNLTKNKTSSPKIKVIKENNSIEEVDCSDKSIPRLDGKNKPDYLTRTYEVNKEKLIVKEIPEFLKLKMQNESKYVYNSIVDDKDKIMLYSENGKMYNKSNSPTIEEYSKNNKISIYDKIKNLKEFESDNQDFLNSNEGKQEYTLYKNIMKGNKLFNKPNESNSSYEEFIN